MAEFEQFNIPKPEEESLPLETEGGVSKLLQGEIQSPNFVTGEAGWALRSDGSIEAIDITATGKFSIGGVSTTIDNTEDIQTKLDEIDADGGGTLFLKSGTYTLTADLTIPAGSTLEGVNRDGVIIDCDNSFAVRMAGTNVYDDGTISINDGDTTVTGSGTTFTSAMVGRYIYLNGLWYEIVTFTDSTHLEISPAYDGSNLSGYDYALADVNFNPTIRKLTIQNATGAGFEIQHVNEPWIDDLVIVDCGTGMDLDYVVFPRIFVLSESNGVNLNMNFVSGFKIDYCSFSGSTSSHGVIMKDCIGATFIDTAVGSCAGDGINMTDCDEINFISNEITANGGQGIEAVSGVNDCTFIATLFDGNTSDGLKLTATSDRNTVVACPITNNGGFGINIAASTCDNNQIIAPAFNNNTSGNLNDNGTDTFVSPQTVEADIQTFTGNGTWTKPSQGSMAIIQAWGGGGSGASGGGDDGGGGGGGGSYVEKIIALSELGSTESVTVGAGGAAVSADATDGNDGANTMFGSLLTAYGGKGGKRGTGTGTPGDGGAGAGILTQGDSSGNGGRPDGGDVGTSGVDGGDSSSGGGGGGFSGTTVANTSAGGFTENGGAGGGGGLSSTDANTNGVGGNSLNGGGGGGGASGRDVDGTGGGDGGTSVNGGDGGKGGDNTGLNDTAGTAGSQPGGGGGGSTTADSGKGGDGKVIVTVV